MGGAKGLSRKQAWKVSNSLEPLSGALQFGGRAWANGSRLEKCSTALRSVVTSVSETSIRSRQSVTGNCLFALDAKPCTSRRFAKVWPAKKQRITAGFGFGFL